MALFQDSSHLLPFAALWMDATSKGSKRARKPTAWLAYFSSVNSLSPVQVPMFKLFLWGILLTQKGSKKPSYGAKEERGLHKGHPADALGMPDIIRNSFPATSASTGAGGIDSLKHLDTNPDR